MRRDRAGTDPTHNVPGPVCTMQLSEDYHELGCYKTLRRAQKKESHLRLRVRRGDENDKAHALATLKVTEIPNRNES